jgi:hypothetical protein
MLESAFPGEPATADALVLGAGISGPLAAGRDRCDAETHPSDTLTPRGLRHPQRELPVLDTP